MSPSLFIVGPSDAVVDQPVAVQVVALDEGGDPAAGVQPLPTLRVIDEAGVEESSVALREILPGIFQPDEELRFGEPGHWLLRVTDPTGRFAPNGLPVACHSVAPELRILWGDIHGHTVLSDGLRSPEAYYAWGRDVARLDFCALSEHSWAIDDAKWDRIRELTHQFHEPNRFVVFTAFEWNQGDARPAPSRGRPNHRNVYFFDPDEDLSPFRPRLSSTPDPSALWALLEGRRAITIPHHTGLPWETHYGTDWSFHDPHFQRLVEIFSDWGSSECPETTYPLPERAPGNFVQDALARGYHLGFVGGSDTHDSRPGLNAVPRQGHPYAWTGLTAVLAPSLTREALWTALWNRRCYATSGGRRILLEVEMDGHPMGSIIASSPPDEERRLVVSVLGTDNLARVIVVKNNRVVHEEPVHSWHARFEWVDPEPPGPEEDFYYVRVEQEDEAMAWSSPIWILSPLNGDAGIEPRLSALDGSHALRTVRSAAVERDDITAETPLTLLDVSGAGLVDHLFLDLWADQSRAMREAVLRVWVDGEGEPSVTTPLDQLFFVSMGGHAYATRVVGAPLLTDSRATYHRQISIPFSHSCRITLTPARGLPLGRVESHIRHGLFDDGQLRDLGRMGRCVSRSLRAFEVQGTETPVELLHIEGRGLLHSLQLAMRNPDSLGVHMEGNVEISVDGEEIPSYASSGTEEFFLGGIYFINSFHTPDAGCTNSIHEGDSAGFESSAYRIFAKDPILFDRELRVVWHNGQRGQGEVPGTTTIDSQAIVYLEREGESLAGLGDPAEWGWRLAALDGGVEAGPLRAVTCTFASLEGSGERVLTDIAGAGCLRRLYLEMEDAGALSLERTAIHILCDDEAAPIMSASLANLFCAGDGTVSFASGPAGFSTDQGVIRLQRSLTVPFRTRLRVTLGGEDQGGRGLAQVTLRQSRTGLPDDFGPWAQPRLTVTDFTVDENAAPIHLLDVEGESRGVIQEITLSLQGVRDHREVPGTLTLMLDGEPTGRWRTDQLFMGLGRRGDAADVTDQAGCLWGSDGVSLFRSFERDPIPFRGDAQLVWDPGDAPVGTRLLAHVIHSTEGPGPTRPLEPRELMRRLTALDGGVSEGRSRCVTVLEAGDVMRGETTTLLDLDGHGTLRNIRVGTPGSAPELRRSHLRIWRTRGEEPVVDTTIEQFFATWFDPFPLWRGAEWVVRPTQLHRLDRSQHTSAYRYLNTPYHERCLVTLTAPEDGDARCLFVQVYAHENDVEFDWGRWAEWHSASVEGQMVEPGQTIDLLATRGRGAVQAVQMALENTSSDSFLQGAFEVFVDGESEPVFRAPNLPSLFLGTPVRGSGEGRQWWEDAATRGPGAPGEGHRLVSSAVGTVLHSEGAPHRLSAFRMLNRDPITFDHGIRIAWTNGAESDWPSDASATRFWSLILYSLGDE